MGLSVLADINDALDRANQFRSIGNIVARLMLTPDAGRILYTPRDNDSHHTWWVPEGYNPGDTATIVLEL